MAIPKYTDPAVQNKTQDNATDHVDEVQQKIDRPAKPKNNSNSSEDKRKGYKEGNKDDSITAGHDDDDNGNKNKKNTSHGKRL